LARRRGGLFWAYEYNQPDIAAYLLFKGADADAVARDGKKPAQLLRGDPVAFQRRVEEMRARFESEPEPEPEQQQQDYQQSMDQPTEDEDEEDRKEL
jgi:hypothetical protein